MNIPLHSTLYEEEAALAKGCGAGNAFAQKKLYSQHAEALMIVCLRYAGNREDAKDLLMQAFAECFRSIGRFEYRGEGSLKAWLKQVAVNQCLMQLRKQRLFTEELQEDAGEQLSETQENSAIARLTVKEIMLWIHALPPGYRAVFNLYVFEDMGHKEIGALLGISESTSKSQLHKARTILQNQIHKLQSIAS